MPLKIYRPKGSKIWYYTGTISGNRLRASTGTTDRKVAARIASQIEHGEWERHLDGPKKQVLMFPQAVAIYLRAHDLNKRQMRYIERIEDYWKNTAVEDMTDGAILQSAIDLHPKNSGATRNRQVLTPTQAIINHCAKLKHCAPILLERFAFEQEIKAPVTLEWLETFCTYAVHPMVRALAVYMFGSGCRWSDAERLDWPEIDFVNRRILIKKTKAKRQRFAYMTQRMLVELANLPRDKKPFWRSETWFRMKWDETVEIAAAAVPGFTRLTFHSCRHGATTKLLHEGIDVVTVGKLVGMSPQQVLKTYGHAQNDPTLTETLFGENLTNENAAPKKIKGLDE